MKLNDKTYDILKWVVMICLPALATAYVGLAAIWGFPYADEVAKTSAVVCALLGALLGISTAEYNRTQAPGKHEPGAEEQGKVPDYEQQAAAEGGTATLAEILADLKDIE